MEPDESAQILSDKIDSVLCVDIPKALQNASEMMQEVFVLTDDQIGKFAKQMLPNIPRFVDPDTLVEPHRDNWHFMIEEKRANPRLAAAGLGNAQLSRKALDTLVNTYVKRELAALHQVNRVKETIRLQVQRPVGNLQSAKSELRRSIDFARQNEARQSDLGSDDVAAEQSDGSKTADTSKNEFETLFARADEAIGQIERLEAVSLSEERKAKLLQDAINALSNRIEIRLEKQRQELVARFNETDGIDIFQQHYRRTFAPKAIEDIFISNTTARIEDVSPNYLRSNTHLNDQVVNGLTLAIKPDGSLIYRLRNRYEQDGTGFLRSWRNRFSFGKTMSFFANLNVRVFRAWKVYWSGPEMDSTENRNPLRGALDVGRTLVGRLGFGGDTQGVNKSETGPVVLTFLDWLAIPSSADKISEGQINFSSTHSIKDLQRNLSEYAGNGDGEGVDFGDVAGESANTCKLDIINTWLLRHGGSEISIDVDAFGLIAIAIRLPSEDLTIRNEAQVIALLCFELIAQVSECTLAGRAGTVIGTSRLLTKVKAWLNNRSATQLLVPSLAILPSPVCGENLEPDTPLSDVAEHVLHEAKAGHLRTTQTQYGSVGGLQRPNPNERAVQHLGNRILKSANCHLDAINASASASSKRGAVSLNDSLEKISTYFRRSSLLIALVWALSMFSTLWSIPGLGDLATVGDGELDQSNLTHWFSLAPDFIKDWLARDWALSSREAEQFSIAVFGSCLLLLSAAFGLTTRLNPETAHKNGVFTVLAWIVFRNRYMVFLVPAVLAVLLGRLGWGFDGDLPMFSGMAGWFAETFTSNAPAVDRITFSDSLSSSVWALPTIGMGLLTQADILLNTSLINVSANQKRLHAIDNIQSSTELLDRYSDWFKAAELGGISSDQRSEIAKRVKAQSSAISDVRTSIGTLRDTISSKQSQFSQSFTRGSFANFALVTIFGLIANSGKFVPTVESETKLKNLLTWASSYGGDANTAEAFRGDPTQLASMGSEGWVNLAVQNSWDQDLLAGCRIPDALRHEVDRFASDERALVFLPQLATLRCLTSISVANAKALQDLKSEVLTKFDGLTTGERKVSITHDVAFDSGAIGKAKSDVAKLLSSLERLEQVRHLQINDWHLQRALGNIARVDDGMNALETERILKVDMTALTNVLAELNNDELGANGTPRQIHLELDPISLDAAKSEIQVLQELLDKLEAQVSVSTVAPGLSPGCDYIGEKRFAPSSAQLGDPSENWWTKNTPASFAALETNFGSHYSDGMFVYVLGSADPSGPIDANNRLAEQRAEVVAEELKASLGINPGGFDPIPLSTGEARWALGQRLPQRLTDDAYRAAQVFVCEQPLGPLILGAN